LPGLGHFQAEPQRALRGRQAGAIKQAAAPNVRFQMTKRAEERIKYDTWRVVLASPSDVNAERKRVPGVLDEINRQIGQILGVRLELHQWETDAYPAFHVDGPQSLIDRVLHIEDADILIGIFWRRLGTPVKDAPSGTVHEFQKAYRAWKKNKRPNIMMYFRKKSFEPTSKDEAEQWGKVIEFRNTFPKEGLWWQYSNPSVFETLLRQQLTNFLMDRKGKKGKRTRPNHR
jgi:hypothetical protein